MNEIRKILCLLIFILAGALTYGQSVPLGIFYQAVARDNFGKELASRNIDIRFSIIKGNKLGTTVYQELHSPVTTSKYGVFSLIIGKGAPTDEGLYRSIDQIDWSNAYHFLKIEVKFENDFVDMGTMQFLAVPYALYAQKSLEPGPQGPRGDMGLQGIQGPQGPAGLKGDTGPQGLKGDTGPQGQQGVQGLKGEPGVKGDTGPQGQQGVQGLKGDPGNPASDDQTLSFDGSNITISGGNTVNLSTLILPHQLTVLGDTLSIMGGNKVALPNHTQDLQLDPNNKLKITKNSLATEIDLSRFLDDKQTLTFSSVDNTLNISGGNTVNLSSLKDDADADPLNEIQSLSYTPADNKLYISGVTNPVDLTDLKNDADASPTNEIQDLSLIANKLKITNNASATEVNLAPYLDNTDSQTLSYDPLTNILTLFNGGNVNLGSRVAFKAGINSVYDLPNNLNTDLNFNILSGNFYSDGSYYSGTSGVFTTPFSGVYTFNVTINLPSGGSTFLKITSASSTIQYETVIGTVSSTGIHHGSIILKLVKDDIVNITVYQNNGYPISSYLLNGSFSGFRVY